MIVPINFLWRQLNGPQIVGITKACYNWCVNQFNALLDYYNDLKILNANSAHLSLMGTLANFSRPMIRLVDMKFFKFADSATNPDAHGFGNLEDLSVGGLFSSVSAVWETERGVPLSDAFFRKVLYTYSQSQGELESLGLLDDICNTLKEFSGGPNASYEITIRDTASDIQDVGDIIINLGRQQDWQNWASVVCAIEALTKTIYAPLPRVYVGFYND